ncbi:hypothetical protein IAU59_004381 [Kwoniella sp. CBS 9459]
MSARSHARLIRGPTQVIIRSFAHSAPCASTSSSSEIASATASSSSVADLSTFAREQARQLRQQNGSSKKKNKEREGLFSGANHRPSMGRQGESDLTVDLSMARSRNVFDRRARSGAPSITLSPRSKSDIEMPPSRSNIRSKGNRAMSSTRGVANLSLPEDKDVSSVVQDGAEAESSLNPSEIEEALTQITSAEPPSTDLASSGTASGNISAREVSIREVKPLREMKIARLRRPLSRVLFSPGVHPLRDSRTGTWNFDPSLHDIPTPEEFAFDRCPQYITPSQDEELLQLAEKNGARFLGSTSTLTKALSQIYFAISGGKGVDIKTLSQDFASGRTDFTPGAELPACIILDKLGGSDKYSVDSDKRWDIENVISDFGRILEKMLTSESSSDFKRFLNSSPEFAVLEAERTEKEAYRYQQMGSLLMRSQLDCYDPRLPGSGVFDIKTRAALPIRYDRANYLANSAYDISKERGYSQSYEREYYDLMRAGMLKFSLQVRIGGMDGIFLAYHNTSRLFGFQYVSLPEIDERIFGSTEMAEQAFKLSVRLLEELLQRCVAAFPDQAINVTLKHSPSIHKHSVTAYVEPKEWDDVSVAGPRPIQAITFTMENSLDGEVIQGPVAFSVDEKTRAAQNWSVKYDVSTSGTDESSQSRAREGLAKLHNDLSAMASLYVPHGQSVASMYKRDHAVRRKEKKEKEKEKQKDKIRRATEHKEAQEIQEEGMTAAATATPSLDGEGIDAASVSPDASAEAQITTEIDQNQTTTLSDRVNEAASPSGSATQVSSSPSSSLSSASSSSEPFVRIRWREPGPRQLQLREEATQSGRAYERRKRGWKKGLYAWKSD